MYLASYLLQPHQTKSLISYAYFGPVRQISMVKDIFPKCRRAIEILSYPFTILVTLITSAVNGPILQGLVLFVALIIGYSINRGNRKRDVRRASLKSLDAMCEDFLFPEIKEIFREECNIGSEGCVRANVMIFRRRDVPPRGERKLLPWKRSLKIDVDDGEYDDGYEDQTKWCAGEGVCGNVIKSGDMIATPLNIDNKEEWNMTSAQYHATEDLESLVSIPIYRDEDENKSDPVGVLNVDSDTEIERDQLQKAGKEIRDYANYAGLLV